MHRPGAPLGRAAVATSLALSLMASACGDEPARIELAPVVIDGSSCGRPSDARTLLVTALGDMPEDAREVQLDAAIAIADFPVATRQLAVEVLGAGGVVRAFGRTPPIDFGSIVDGARVPILMAPPDDGCPVGDLGTARDRPLVIAAGDGVLVVGGRGDGDGDGDVEPLGTAEWYDLATGGFEPIDTPQALRSALGAAGMAAATLPDGRIVLLGGARPVFVIFDPATRAFEEDTGALFELRAHAAAVALDDHRILVAGGCGNLEDDGTCEVGSDRTSSFIVDTSPGGEPIDGPGLALARIGGTAHLELDPSGLDTPRVVLIGGHDGAGAPVSDAERLDPDDDPGTAGEVIADAGGIAVPLASGSVLAGFGGELAASGAIAVVAPGVADARAQATFLARQQPTLTALEDGSVLVVGGSGDVAPVARYRPAEGTVITVAADPVGLSGMPAGRAGHRAARLPDGTVLVVGGRDAGGAPRADAWVFRPDRDGPFTGAVTVTPGDDPDVPLVPLDPGAIDASDGYRLLGAGDQLTSWVVIGGMQPRQVEVAATVSVTGGVAVLLGFTDAAHLDVIELRDGALARLRRRDGASGVEQCRGQPIDAEALGGGAAVSLLVTARNGQLAVALAGVTVLSCAYDEPRPGLVGLAALGAGAEVTLSTVAVTR